MSFPSDLEIAQKAHLQPVTTIAARLGIDADDIHRAGSEHRKDGQAVGW